MMAMMMMTVVPVDIVFLPGSVLEFDVHCPCGQNSNKRRRQIGNDAGIKEAKRQARPDLLGDGPGESAWRQAYQRYQRRRRGLAAVSPMRKAKPSSHMTSAASASHHRT